MRFLLCFSSAWLIFSVWCRLLLEPCFYATCWLGPMHPLRVLSAACANTNSARLLTYKSGDVDPNSSDDDGDNDEQCVSVMARLALKVWLPWCSGPVTPMWKMQTLERSKIVRSPCLSRALGSMLVECVGRRLHEASNGLAIWRCMLQGGRRARVVPLSFTCGALWIGAPLTCTSPSQVQSVRLWLRPTSLLFCFSTQCLYLVFRSSIQNSQSCPFLSVQHLFSLSM